MPNHVNKRHFSKSRRRVENITIKKKTWLKVFSLLIYYRYAPDDRRARWTSIFINVIMTESDDTRTAVYVVYAISSVYSILLYFLAPLKVTSPAIWDPPFKQLCTSSCWRLLSQSWVINRRAFRQLPPCQTLLLVTLYYMLIWYVELSFCAPTRSHSCIEGLATK